MDPWILPAVGAGVGALGGLLGRDSRQTVQTVSGGNDRGQSSFTPYSGASPLYSMVGGIANQMGNTQIPFFPGQGYVSPSIPTQRGVQMGMEALPGFGAAGQQMLDAQRGMNGLIGQSWKNFNTLSNAADVGNNPYVQDIMGQNADLLNRNFSEGLMPQIRESAIQNNSLGGSRQGIAEGVAARGTQEAISDANERLLLGAYDRGLGAQQQALGQTGSMLNNLLAPSQATLGAANMGLQAANTALGLGQRVEDYQGRALDDAMTRFTYQYEEPWQRMGNLGQALGLLQPLGVAHSSGQNQSTGVGVNPNYQSPFQVALGGGMTGGVLGAGFSDWLSRRQGPSMGLNYGAHAGSLANTNYRF
jgi:hypothetical protein